MSNVVPRQLALLQTIPLQLRQQVPIKLTLERQLTSQSNKKQKPLQLRANQQSKMQNDDYNQELIISMR